MADSLVETCWRVRGRSGYEFRCELHRVGDYVEVRVSYDDAKLVHAELAHGIEVARRLAQEWFRKIIELQGMQESS